MKTYVSAKDELYKAIRISGSVSQSRILRQETHSSSLSIHRVAHQRNSKMVQWSSDNDDTGAEFNLLRDREEMQNVLHQYEQLLMAFSFGIEQRGTEYFSDYLENDLNDVAPWTGLITEAKHIMAFIMREDKDCSKREKVD